MGGPRAQKSDGNQIRHSTRFPDSPPTDPILQWGTAPLAILPTDDSTTLLACTADSALDDVQQSYANFSRVCRENRRPPAKLRFTKHTNPADTATTSAAARSLLQTLRREINRLEHESCKWRPRSYFAERQRHFEKLVHAKCAALEGTSAPSVLIPNPSSHGRKKCTRDDAAMPSDERAENRAQPVYNNSPEPPPSEMEDVTSPAINEPTN